MKRLTNFIDEVAENPTKGLVYAIFIVIGIIIVMYLWKKLKQAYTAVKDEITNVVDNPVDSSKLTHPDNWYKTSAEAMFIAMNGWGTDIDAITTVIVNLANQDDWNELSRRYGTRTLEHFGYSDVTGNLANHLQYELDQYEKQNLNFHLRNRNIAVVL